jgi:hypothetical protein
VVIVYLFDFTITGSLGATAGHDNLRREAEASFRLKNTKTTAKKRAGSDRDSVRDSEVVFSELAKTVLQDPVIPAGRMLANCLMNPNDLGHDWVLEDRLRKLTEDNRELANNLRREAEASFRLKSRTESRSEPARFLAVVLVFFRRKEASASRRKLLAISYCTCF